jgi:glutamate--cysteine ligase
MEAHFDHTGPDGRRMMCNTAALQVNIDAAAGLERECWRTAHAIGPAMVAAFANSPDDAGRRSTRVATWLAMDQRRTGAVTGELPSGWFDYALAAPAILGRDDDGDCVALPPGLVFGEWLDLGSACGFPSLEDLAYHLTLLFPPVRPRGWLEVRYLDALPSPWWEVAVRVLAALLSPDALNGARRAVLGTETLWHEAAAHGLDDERLAQAADRCFAIALDATADAGVADYMERYVARRVPAWA